MATKAQLLEEAKVLGIELTGDENVKQLTALIEAKNEETPEDESAPVVEPTSEVPVEDVQPPAAPEEAQPEVPADLPVPEAPTEPPVEPAPETPAPAVELPTDAHSYYVWKDGVFIKFFTNEEFKGEALKFARQFAEEIGGTVEI